MRPIKAQQLVGEELSVGNHICLDRVCEMSSGFARLMNTCAYVRCIVLKQYITMQPDSIIHTQLVICTSQMQYDTEVISLQICFRQSIWHT